MIPTEVFDRFAQGDYIPLMAQAAMEHALSPRVVDQLFEEAAERQYTRDLLFSSVVGLMSLVVCRIRPSVHAAYQKGAVPITVTLPALYGKIERTEPTVGAALVRLTADRLAAVIRAMHDGGMVAPLPGYRTKILDGNHLPGSEHRIKELRTMRAGALPGHTLVVLDPEAMLVIDAFPCEDGHAQERSLLAQVEATVRPKDLWIADRNFCTTGFLFGIKRRDGFFLIRQHASTLTYTTVGKRKDRGRTETGRLFEQTLRATNGAGEVLYVRRVTVVLDKPTRDGETEIHLLTNLPVKHARAAVVAELYRRRWTIETAFAEMEETLNGEINALGYPKAALFSFCMALVAYNVLATVKAALRSAHGQAKVAELSGYYLADEVQMCHRGMMRAIPKDEWVVFQDAPAPALAELLTEWARSVPLADYVSHPRGPKKPKPQKQSGAKIKHVSTFKVLEARKLCKTAHL
jgi:IS4 transposase